MAVAVLDDARLVEGLGDGDEGTFTELHVRLGPAMRRAAQSIVHDRDVADEVVQETWLGVVSAIHRFQGRSLLRTWIFRILTNTAISHAAREARSASFSALAAGDETGTRSSADDFLGSDPRAAGLQRAVVTMRDVEGYEAGEVCRALGLSDANQRVLLHRARSNLRAALSSFVLNG